ncbi:hypothetical protein Thu_162 [Bacillus phage Thurquoise]|nr:hypothetical protein Thu_162 [Bacillus phage Thurquoise]
MNLVEKIKKQNELQKKIAKLEDESYDLGEEIYEGFEELPEDQILEHYNMMEREDDSIVRFEIFKDFIHANKEKLKGWL